jgi:hypothetical protein
MGSIPDHAPLSVSVENQVPQDLYDAMRDFVRRHPQWDQYRLMQAALAGFLFQHGCQDRAVVRHYLDGLFRRQGQAAPLDSSFEDTRAVESGHGPTTDRRSSNPPLATKSMSAAELPSRSPGSGANPPCCRPRPPQR